MSFLNLRIRGRLYGGFGALLLFCAALAGFGVWQLGDFATQVAAMTLQSENTIRVGEIATNLQAIRRAHPALRVRPGREHPSRKPRSV